MSSRTDQGTQSMPTYFVGPLSNHHQTSIQSLDLHPVIGPPSSHQTSIPSLDLHPVIGPPSSHWTSIQSSDLHPIIGPQSYSHVSSSDSGKGSRTCKVAKSWRILAQAKIHNFRLDKGPQASDIIITWDLVRNAHFQVLPHSPKIFWI
jgi:hypothetical protein